MGRHILVGIDGSEQARNALEYALEEFPDARITALTVIDPVSVTAGGDFFDESLIDQQREFAEKYLSTAADIAADHDREIETEVRVGRPSRELIEYATDVEADHIVVASRGKTGLSRVLLGSVAESVVRRAPVPVTVVR